MRRKSLPIRGRYQPVAALTLLLGGCLSPDQALRQQSAIDSLSNRVDHLSQTVRDTRALVGDLQEAEADRSGAMQTTLADLEQQVGALPGTLKRLCATEPAQATDAACNNDQPPHTVMVAGDKMVVGEMERVWLDPPGLSVVARIDTGANSSSVHAENLVEFERDGDDWVRFEWDLEGKKETLERQVVRYVRVIQQSDKDGTRRPVVELRLRLGNVEDTYEFTLANRAHLEHQIILGRNFLTDVALVDVGHKFVQPAYKPQ